MGISASCTARYPYEYDFIQFIQNAPKIISSDCPIWTYEEKHCLKAFFSNLTHALENTSNPNSQLPWYFPNGPGDNWPTDPLFLNYYCRVRLAVAKSKSAPEIYALSGNPSIGSGGGIGGFNDNFYDLNQTTQIQLAHLYAAMAFLWTLYRYRNSPLQYFLESDILYYLCQDNMNDTIIINCPSIDLCIKALSKIYFTGKSNSIPPNSLLIASYPFTLFQGNLIKLFPHRCNVNMHCVPTGVYMTVNCGDEMCTNAIILESYIGSGVVDTTISQRIGKSTSSECQCKNDHLDQKDNFCDSSYESDSENY